MYDFLVELGFQKFDYALIQLCVLGSVMGSFANILLLDTNFNKLPSDPRILSNLHAYGRGVWMLSRIILGAILGVAVGAYFVGALHQDISAVAKVFVLSIVTGFSAPKLWLAQEKVIVEQAANKIEEILGAKNKEINVVEPEEGKL
jgi:hypothetical protein